MLFGCSVGVDRIAGSARLVEGTVYSFIYYTCHCCPE